MTMKLITTEAEEFTPRKTEERSMFWPVLFLICLTIPMNFDFGSMRLSLYRIVLLALLLPCIFGWIAGKAGKKILADIFMALFAAWSVVSMVVTMGFDDALQPAGIWVIETLGAYFLARLFIRDERSFRVMVKTLFFIVAVLLPLAISESVLNRPVALQFFGSIGKTIAITNMEQRAGLRRAQVVFEHPILFGVFSSSIFSLSFYLLGSAKSKFGALLRGMVAVTATLCSLSTGAFLSLAVQSVLMAWDIVMRKVNRKWTILAVIFVFFYILIDAYSNRTPIEVFISYLTFNFSNSFNRILIWQYGTGQIYLTPWFGTGFADNWSRPEWMHSSMDNFWLLIAVRYGLPAFVFLAAAYLSIFRHIGKVKLKDQVLIDARKGLLFAIIGISVAICTVHLWNASYCLFMFLLGSGAWLAELGNKIEPADGCVVVGSDTLLDHRAMSSK
jgi:O-Antigen ligase